LVLFLKESISSEANFQFTALFYNKSDFHQNDLEQVHFYSEIEEKIVSHAGFTLSSSTAYAPLRAPFGGLEYAPSLGFQALESILSEVELRLRSKGIKEVIYHQSPSAYQSSELLNSVFEALKYELTEQRIFHTIQISQESLESRMHKMERRKLAACLSAGTVFKELKGDDRIEVFKWVDEHRSALGKPSSMTWRDLKEAFLRNPDFYHTFGVYLNGKLLAATVAVRVSKDSLYHFLPTSVSNLPEYKKYSPMVYLMNSLYEWCQTKDIHLLDLGSSYVKGELKTSLVQFKENMGATPSLAHSWKKVL